MNAALQLQEAKRRGRRKRKGGDLAKMTSQGAPNNTHKEDFRIQIDTIFRDFLNNPDVVDIDFSSDLSNLERKYVHERSRKLGLKSKSRGKEPNRILYVTKQQNRSNLYARDLMLCRPAFEILSNFTRRNPFLVPLGVEEVSKFDQTAGRLIFGAPTFVDAVENGNFSEVKESLPTFTMRTDIMNAIEDNKITIISAETGSGKTTQIPQYILEEATLLKRPCRVICTQPRRISTVAIAERVSSERGEPLGSTVGYQIKLESRLGPKTSLIYCTTGVLLRTLMINTNSLSQVTHVIIDEIHERDRFTDFLLIYLKENLNRFPDLKVILMSATMDVESFLNYFYKLPVVLSIPGRNFPITELYLDDILGLINYKSSEMRNVLKGDCQVRLDDVDISLLKEMDVALLQCLNVGLDDDFVQILQLIMTDKVPVNYSDVDYGYTALMVAAAKGRKDIVETLLNLGADVSITCKSGTTAAGYAASFGNNEIFDLLQWFASDSEHRLKHAQLTDVYDRTISDDVIDHELIVAIILYIQANLSQTDGILVFLPGYDNIISCADKISNSHIDQGRIKVCILHGGMHISAQNDVFLPCHGKQKIILSTNVAETSITLDDVVFVINSGKVKEKTYESIGGTSSLVTKWASMACIRQRAGRAGRTKPGMCFHLLSKKRYESLQIHTIPEILRTPLHELCLQTKLLAPTDSPIEEFLLKAMEQPAKTSISTAIKGLITMGALDQDEKLTRLGSFLLQLSVEPHLGKMLIYSVIFKCIDPILTIVATLAHKEPFVLPTFGSEKGQANTKRKSLSFGSLSDHMCLLKAYQLWQKSKQQRKEREFCREYFVSYGAMEMIMATRNHIMGQLRACGFIPANGKEIMHELSKNSDHWPLVKSVLAAGLYPNVAFPNGDKFHTMTESKVVMHPTSALRNVVINSELWCIFDDISKLGAICNIKNVTAITPATIAFACGSSAYFEDETKAIIINDKLQININSQIIWKFRALLDDLIKRKIENPRMKPSRGEDLIVDTFDNILSAEDSSKDLFQPPGIGDRPLFIYGKTDTLPNEVGEGHRNYNKYERHAYRKNGYNRNEASGSRDYHNRSEDEFLVNAIAPKNVQIPSDARFFVIRPSETRNIMISVSQGTWNFSPQTERKIFRLFTRGCFVVLLFNVRGTNYFQGVARLLDTNKGQPNVPSPIEWLGTNKTSYERIKHLVHPKVHMVEDGLELSFDVGMELARMLMENPPGKNGNCRPILGAGASRNEKRN